MATIKGKLKTKSGDVMYPETSADKVVGLGAQVIVLEDNGTTTAGTWLAKTDRISSLAEGQLFLYKLTKAGASTTTLNITGSAGTALGAKNIYRVGTTKLTTQYPVGAYIMLYYNGSTFTVVNDYDANSYAYLRQYQAGDNVAGTGTKYPILTRYNLTNKHGSYDTAYSRFHTDVTIDTNNGTLDAPTLSEDGTPISDKYYLASNPSNFTSNVGTITGIKMNGASKGTSGVVDLGTVITDVSTKADLVDGKVPSSQLPSYVDDVLEYSAKSSFPATGESGKIYVDTSTNKTYRWGGSAYVEISPSLAIGTTSTTAAAGNHTHANMAVTNADNNFSATQTFKNITLYSASGDSPRITFQRGTLTDGYNDWSIYDSGGYLHIQERGNGSSSWGSRVTITQTGANFNGTLTENSKAVATQEWVTNKGYTTNVGTVTSVNNVSPTNGNVTIAIPTKTSDLTNDSGFLTSHQSLANYVTLNSAQEVSGKKSFTQKPVFKETTVLPSGYQQVKYITASGTQYIDTGYKQTTEKMKVEFACSFPYPTGGMSLFGSNSNYDLVPYSSGNYAFSHWVGASGGIVPVTYDPDYNEATYILDNGSLSINLNGATSTGTYTGTIINNYNFFIFGKNGAGSSGERGSGYRLYFLKLYDNGTLVRNLVPCYRESDDEIGLYDLVGNTFYPNSGSGTFAKGGKIGESPFATEEDLSLCVKSVNNASPDSNGNVSITIPSYESKTAVSGGTAVSLVTTGEKYTWNNKANLSGGNTFSGIQKVVGASFVSESVADSAPRGTYSASYAKIEEDSTHCVVYRGSGIISKQITSGSTTDSYNVSIPSKTGTLALTSDIKVTNATVSYTGTGQAVTSLSISDGQIVAERGATNYVTTNGTQTITGQKTFSASPILNNNKFLTVKNTSNGTYAVLGMDSSNILQIGNTLNALCINSSSVVRPHANGSVNLGNSGFRWKTLYVSNGISDGTNTLTIPSKSGTIALTSDLPSTTDSVVKWTGQITDLRTDNASLKPSFTGTIVWDKYAKKVQIVGGFYCSSYAEISGGKWPIDKILAKVGLTASNIRTPADLDVGSAIIIEQYPNNGVVTTWMAMGGGTVRYDVNSASGTGTAGLWYGRYYDFNSANWGGFDVYIFGRDNLSCQFSAILEVY